MENLKPYTDFCDDEEKMFDFFALSKEDFLDSYSYLTEEEYDMTAKKAVPKTYNIILRSWGGTVRPFMDGLSAKDALDFCNFYDWKWQMEEGGYVWDMDVEVEK